MNCSDQPVRFDSNSENLKGVKAMLPKDPMMLLSYVNTQLRDHYPSLQEFCAAEAAEEQSIREKLSLIDYEYDAELNKFV